ncbi:hypothetical protein K438DRAFT_1940235 [Mycena galopus ATCC 62051]|nr:hypothetical protein K438DRAFT_1940235 [Mycena galopus ATCC 62051]
MSSASSLESSQDDTSVQDVKAAQAAQFNKLSRQSDPLKFKEAQAEGFGMDYARPMPPKKQRSVGQAAATRRRSTAPQQTPAQLLQLLATDKKETKETRDLLHTTLAQLDASSRRLAQSDAERRALESSQLSRVAQTLAAASVVQQNAAAAQAQLSLYQLQLQTARAEIERAQGVVRALEAQRDDAEENAVQARSLARKLHVENRSIIAREEGRRLGYDAGYEHGRTIAAAKEQRRREREQGRLEAEMRRRQIQIQIAPPGPVSVPREPGSAFIEDHVSEAEDEERNGTVSRAVSGSRRSVPPPQQETRRRRDTLDSVRSAQRQPQQRPAEEPPPAAPAEPQPVPQPEPPPELQPPPQPAPITVVINNNPPSQPQRPPSGSSSRRVSAPPAAQPQPPHPRVIDFGASRPRATSTASRAGGPPGPSSTNTSSTTLDAAPNPNPNRTSVGATSQHTRRNSAASRASAGAAAAAPAYRRAAPTSASDEVLGLGRPSRPMTMETMIRNIPMPPPPAMPEPIIVMPQHVPMPPPPAPPVHVPMPVPVPQPQFEVERPERRETRAQSPSSVGTSLGTLRLTSFPPVAPGSGAGSDRDYPTGMGMAGVGAGGGGVGLGRDRERELSTIIEHATGESQSQQLGNAWDTVRQQTPWTRRSSPYSDPRGMEEWRRETDEEAVRPPPSPVTSPRMLSPYDALRPPQNSNAQQRPSQQSFQSDLRRSDSGSTVNITIVPPSRPTSVGNSSGLPPARGSEHFLSPNQAHVVPEEDEDDDDDGEDDDESDSDAPVPPGFVMGPLPAFAQGVPHLPPGFVPMGPGAAPAAGNAQPQMSTGAGSAWGEPNTTWTAPPAIGANSIEPVRPPSQGMRGTPANANLAATWAAPPVMGAAPTHPSRPSSRGAGMLNNPANAARAAPPFTVEPAARPPSRTGNPAGTFAAESGHSASRRTPAGFTVEPARPPSRLGHPAGTYTADPAHSPNRQAGGILGNHAGAFTVERPQSRTAMHGTSANARYAPPVMGANAMGPPQQSSGNTPNIQWGAQPPNWTLDGQYAFGATANQSQNQPPLGFVVEPATRPPSRLGNPNPAGAFTAEPARGGIPGNPQAPGAFTLEHPQSRNAMHGTPANTLGAPPVMGGNAMGPPQQPSGPPGQTFTLERPQSRNAMHGTSANAWGAPPVMGGNAMGPPQQPSGPPEPQCHARNFRQRLGCPPVMGGNAMGPPQQPSGPPGQMGGPPGANWARGGQYPPFGQTSTPVTQGAPALGFVPTNQPPLGFQASPAVGPLSPLPTRPQPFLGADNPPMRSTTPRPIYAPAAAPSGIYAAPTAGIAAGYPLPTSRSTSTATTATSHQRSTSLGLNAGTTPAAGFNARALSPGSRASSGGGGRTFPPRYGNQTPNPNANLGITNPYTSVVEEGSPGSEGSALSYRNQMPNPNTNLGITNPYTNTVEEGSPGSDSSGLSLGLGRMSSFDRITANNTLANAGAGYSGGPVIPPSPSRPHSRLR